MVSSRGTPTTKVSIRGFAIPVGSRADHALFLDIDRTHGGFRQSYSSRFVGAAFAIPESNRSRSLTETQGATILATDSSDTDSDQERFRRLVDDHGAALMAFLRRLCDGSIHDAEDVFQDVAARVWRHLQSRSASITPRNPRGWLFAVAYRAFLDHQSHRARAPAGLSLFDSDGRENGDLAQRSNSCPSDGDPVAAAEREERKHMVNAALAELSTPIRSVLAMHYSGGLSLREIAEALNLSIGTVKSRLSAGLEQLRRRMS